MKSKYLVLFSVLAIAVMLSGCIGGKDDAGGGEGGAGGDDGEGIEAPETFRLLVSDAPADIGDFDSVLVTFEKVRIFEDDEIYEEKTISADAVDLAKLTDDLTYPLIDLDLEVGEYTKVELYIDTIEATIAGELVEIKVPSDKLQITIPFSVAENETTSFVFDINVVKKGATGEYNLLPVISESGTVGKELKKEKVKECDAHGKSCQAFEVAEQARVHNWERVRELARGMNGDEDEEDKENGKPEGAGKPDGAGGDDEDDSDNGTVGDDGDIGDGSDEEVSEESLCADAGGEWKTLGSGCADSCELVRNPDTICITVETDGCDCGADKCWTGEICELN